MKANKVGKAPLAQARMDSGDIMAAIYQPPTVPGTVLVLPFHRITELSNSTIIIYYLANIP